MARVLAALALALPVEGIAVSPGLPLVRVCTSDGFVRLVPFGVPDRAPEERHACHAAAVCTRQQQVPVPGGKAQRP
ncbi:hypothetical protein [Parvularcula lutaonensis]|uniref:hypothetical protein n=1 Tax=Parvularcula lutaonensis TaxID=491923 RepID=UPI0016781696|nr:hypothetical protein [Parvularcula lutaonensis]